MPRRDCSPATSRWSASNLKKPGKAFMSVALLYDDPEITPQALAKAAKAYQQGRQTRRSRASQRQLHQKYPDYAGG